MYKTVKQIAFPLAAPLALIACTKEIPLTQEEIRPRIVVNALFEENDTVWVHLSESRNILFSGSLPHIPNATARWLDASGTELGEFTHAEDGKYYLTSPTPVPGKAYGISVDVPEMGRVEATSTLPSAIEVISVDTASGQSSEGYKQMEFAINIQDDGNQKNYYGISIVTHDVHFNNEDSSSYSSYAYPYFSTKELFVVNGESDILDGGEKYGRVFFFPDDQFNGGTIAFKGTKELWSGGDSTYFVVQVESLSEAAYRYRLSYTNYSASLEDELFTEPVQVYSNIEGGFGVFGGLSSHKDTFYIE